MVVSGIEYCFHLNSPLVSSNLCLRMWNQTEVKEELQNNSLKAHKMEKFPLCSNTEMVKSMQKERV